MTRTWLTFRDLRIGDRFRINFDGPEAPWRSIRTSNILVKISSRKYRTEGGSEWPIRANVPVKIE